MTCNLSNNNIPCSTFQIVKEFKPHIQCFHQLLLIKINPQIYWHKGTIILLCSWISQVGNSEKSHNGHNLFLLHSVWELSWENSRFTSWPQIECQLNISRWPLHVTEFLIMRRLISQSKCLREVIWKFSILWPGLGNHIASLLPVKIPPISREGTKTLFLEGRSVKGTL